MAVAGAMTTAYNIVPAKDKLHATKTTYPSDRCTPPAVAVNLLRNWTADSRPVIVQGSDMAQFWALWGGVN